MNAFKRIILPIVFVVVAYVLGVFAFGILAPNDIRKEGNLTYRRPAYGHLLKRTNEAETIKDVDILILGSSHAYRGFDPRIFSEFNIKIFNFGSSSQSPIQSEYLCKKYLDQMKPELVIMETYPILFSNDGVESTLDLISNGSFDLRLLRMAAKTPDPRVVNNYFYRLMADMTGIKREYQPMKKKMDTYIKGGFVQKETEDRANARIHPDHSIEIIPKQKEAIVNLVNYCKLKNINVLLVQAPVSSSYYSSLKKMEDFDTAMAKIAPYKNYNKKTPLVDSLHFYDKHHLNLAGVEVFNRRLIVDLEKLNEL